MKFQILRTFLANRTNVASAKLNLESFYLTDFLQFFNITAKRYPICSQTKVSNCNCNPLPCESAANCKIRQYLRSDPSRITARTATVKPNNPRISRSCPCDPLRYSSCNPQLSSSTDPSRRTNIAGRGVEVNSRRVCRPTYLLRVASLQLGFHEWETKC